VIQRYGFRTDCYLGQYSTGPRALATLSVSTLMCDTWT